MHFLVVGSHLPVSHSWGFAGLQGCPTFNFVVVPGTRPPGTYLEQSHVGKPYWEQEYCAPPTVTVPVQPEGGPVLVPVFVQSS